MQLFMGDLYLATINCHFRKEINKFEIPALMGQKKLLNGPTVSNIGT